MLEETLDTNVISTDLEQLEDDSVKVTVTIDAAEVDRRIKRAYGKLGKEYRFNGFRRGHVPRQVIDRMLGADAAHAQATDDLLNDSYPLALDSCNAIPLADPEFGADKLVEDGQGYSYTMTLKVKPQFDLSSYDPVEIKIPSEEATDGEIDTQIEALRSYQYTFEDIMDREIVEEDYVTLKIEASSNGEKVERYSNDERIYRLGGGFMPAKFDENLVGVKPGDSVSFTLEPGDGLDDGIEEPVDFTVTVLKIREKVFAEVDDEFAVKCGAEDLADLRAKLAEGIAESKKNSIPRLKEDRAVAKLAKRLQGEPGEDYVNAMHQDLAQQLFTNLQQSGMTLDAYIARLGITADEFRDDLKQQAVDMAKETLALDAYARNLGIGASDDDIVAQFQEASDPDEPIDFDDIIEQWRAAGRIPALKEAVIRSKATAALLESAVVTVSDEPDEEEDGESPVEETLAEEQAAPEAEAAADDAEETVEA